MDNNEVKQDALDEAAKSLQDQQAALAGEFRKELETPIGEDDARKALAELEIQLAQLAVQRVRALSQVNAAQQAVNRVDEQIAVARGEQQVIYRRSLNVVGGGADGE